ncbi:MAG TPA: alpha/beta hydrolase family protein [Acidobacteriaceae bacterium]|nr:alpha/beta hydrolase family protein [Acidobacteriaceae bacterium]
MRPVAKTFYIALMLFVVILPLQSSAQRLNPAPPASGDIVEQHSFFSAALQRQMRYDIVLPVGYSVGQQRYPVLYLLHGWQGDETNWVKLTHLVELASHYALIIVTPEAANSWYVNSATNPADRYADYIADDLITEIDGHYRTIASSHQRAIAGLSMGGYGALLQTLHHPGLFSFTASISGAFDGPSGADQIMPQLKPSTDQAFGSPGTTTRKQNDLDVLIAAADPAKTPYMLLDCGTADPFLPSNRHVVEELWSRGVSYEYHELPGAHTWSFWDNSLPNLFDVLSRKLHLEQPAVAARAAVR